MSAPRMCTVYPFAVFIYVAKSRLKAYRTRRVRFITFYIGFRESPRDISLSSYFSQIISNYLPVTLWLQPDTLVISLMVYLSKIPPMYSSWSTITHFSRVCETLYETISVYFSLFFPTLQSETKMPTGAVYFRCVTARRLVKAASRNGKSTLKSSPERKI